MTRLLLVVISLCTLGAFADDNEIRGTTKSGHKIFLTSDLARTSVRGSFDPGNGEQELLFLERKDRTVNGIYLERFEIVIAESRDVDERIYGLEISLKDTQSSFDNYRFNARVREDNGITEITMVGAMLKEGLIQSGTIRYDSKKNKMSSTSDLMNNEHYRSQMTKVLKCNKADQCTLKGQLDEDDNNHIRDEFKFTEKGSLALKELAKDPAMLFAIHFLELYQFFRD